VEQSVLQVLTRSIHDLSRTRFLSGLRPEVVSFLRNSLGDYYGEVRKIDIEFSSDGENVTRKVRFVPWHRSPLVWKYDVTSGSVWSHSERPLLHGKVKFNLGSQRVSMSTFEDSILKRDRLGQIPEPTISVKERCEAVDRLTSGYIELVRAELAECVLDKKHFLYEMAQESVLLPSAKGRDVPLPFPKTLMRRLQEQFKDYHEIQALGIDLLSPVYRFSQDEVMGPCKLEIQFLTEEAKLAMSYTVACFDAYSYLAFGQTKTIEGSRGKREIRVQEPVNPSEFLLTMMFCWLDTGLSVPGSGTVTIPTPGGLPLIAPKEDHEFPGLWNLLVRHPDKMLDYDCMRTAPSSAWMLDRPTVTVGPEMATIKDKIAKTKASLESKLKEYRNRFHYLETHVAWLSGLNEATRDVWLLYELNLPPADVAVLSRFAATNPRDPEENDIDEFERFIKAVPSKGPIELKRLGKRLDTLKQLLESKVNECKE